jgi:hypothetical protein
LKANLEQGFWNIINGQKISSSKRLSVDYAVTDEQVATVPDVERALLVMAISAARNAFSGWDAVAFAGTLERGGNDSRAITDPERMSLFGSVELVPLIRKPGRSGLASTLLEILSFRPTRMKTQTLVWSLARKASYTAPFFW